jgi:rod shape-determining protein MreD
MIVFLQSLIRFIVLVLVQVLILNNINFLGFINPYLYILFIITLPINLARSYVLLIAFVLGLSIDIFTGTLGMHASATVAAAFVRAPLIKIFASRDSNHELESPSLKSFGAFNFIYYAALMVLVHHTILFMVDTFSFHRIGYTILLILSNVVFTLALLIGIESVSLKKK